MKVPGYIKKAIKKVAYHSRIAKRNDGIVRDWLEENHIISDVDNLLDGYTTPFYLDMYIDECELGGGDGSCTIQTLEEIEDKHFIKEITSNGKHRQRD